MTQNTLNYEFLKSKQRTIQDGFDENLGLRIHRSLSWLQRAEKAKSDPDAQFIFYWIAFNASYAEELPDNNTPSERSVFEKYFIKILSFDKQQIIYEAIWQKYSGPIRLILNNKFVYQPFWNHYNGFDGYSDWNERFQKSKKSVSQALATKDTKYILSTLFDRLYVLRNQLIHGGATWNSSINRDQIRDGSQLLGFLLPVFLDLMMDNPSTVWGTPHYPVIKEI